MDESKTIHAVEMVRRIRDELVSELAGKPDAEVVAFYRKAAETFQNAKRKHEPRRHKKGGRLIRAST